MLLVPGRPSGPPYLHSVYKYTKVKEILRAASEQAKPHNHDNQHDTTSHQTMHFDRFPDHLRIDLLNRPFAAKPSRDLLVIKLWAIT